MSATRCCSQCDAEQPLSEFSANGRGGVRTICRICERFNTRSRVRMRPKPTRREMHSDWLPVEPFRDWLRQRISEEETDYETYASRLGISARRISEIVRGRTRFARIELIDRALLADGWHLSHLYPDMYPDASPAVIDLLQRVGEVEATAVWENEHQREAA